MIISEKIDCKYFKGDVPCLPHKKSGVHCDKCSYYSSFSKSIVIIKLGAAGDVIRTTPLITKIKQEYPGSEIVWITYFPELVPSIVDTVIKFDLKNLLWLSAASFDIVYNLDKDKEAIYLAELINAKIKKGFLVKEGKCYPADNDAIYKWKTGIWDDLTRVNKKSYPQEIFEICGFNFNKEKYILDKPIKFKTIGFNRKYPKIGLNTGCGMRWPTRIWPDEYWIELAKKLKRSNFEVVLLGGQDEHLKNLKIASMSGASYFGYFPINQFVSLVNECKLVVTGVTMALHIAIGLKKRIVLLNNVFNRNEFELYGLGEIVEPKLECLACYKQKCKIKCMEMVKPERIYNSCKKLLK